MVRLSDSVFFLWHFARARWGLAFRDRAHLDAWQHARVRRFLARSLRRFPFYSADVRSGPPQLQALPIVDKAFLLEHFAGFNSAGVSLEMALQLAECAERTRDFASTLPGDLTVGMSSGTSGRRGVFLVSRRERLLWAAVILARTLDGAALRRCLLPWKPALRVAFFLRANSRLYTTVDSRRIAFGFHDLLLPLEDHLTRLNDFPPDVLVAPASVLHVLAQRQLAGQLRIQPARVVNVAEVLEDDDRRLITAAWACPPAQIYQCTEGFLAVSCRAGSVHLNEEYVHVEPEWLDAEQTRFTPIVTDFHRTTQAIVRYRLDDILHVLAGPCRCGRVTTRIAAIEGRRDDLLWLPACQDGELHAVFPDAIRRSMALAQSRPDGGPTFDEYRITQRGDLWEVQLGPQAGDAGMAWIARIRTEIEGLCLSAGLQTPRIALLPWRAPAPGSKRRRVQCAQRPERVT